MLREDESVLLEGSERIPLPLAQLVGKTPPTQMLTVTVALYPQEQIPKPGAPGSRSLSDATAEPGTHAQVLERFGASETAIAKVHAFAQEQGLHVIDTNKAARTVKLSGTVEQMEQAFHVDLYEYDHPGGQYRGRSGGIYLPANLIPLVSGVFGLDNRPVATPHLRRAEEAAPRVAGEEGLSARDMAKIYEFPDNLNGAGQTIAILEFNSLRNGVPKGTGFKPSDLALYFGDLGLPMPDVRQVLVPGGINDPGIDANADSEVLLDIQVAGAVASGAQIDVYFSQNTGAGWLAALDEVFTKAAQRTSVISISWGASEDSAFWSGQLIGELEQRFSLADQLGITICCASGDNGSSDGVLDGGAHVDYPASSPGVLGCGGTLVTVVGDTLIEEEVWNDPGGGATGGGVSTLFPFVPDWQSAAGVPVSVTTGFEGRGVPDVAGNASPQAAYRIVQDGVWRVIGGTSAVAPLWAGLIVCLNQHLGARLGFANPRLYQAAARSGVFRDIILGDNGDYTAGMGWDPCTGLGSPNATALLNAL